MTEIKHIYEVITQLSDHDCMVIDPDKETIYPTIDTTLPTDKIREKVTKGEGLTTPLFVVDNKTYRQKHITVKEHTYLIVCLEEYRDDFLLKYRKLLNQLQEMVFVFRDTNLIFRNQQAAEYFQLHHMKNNKLKYNDFLDDDNLQKLHDFIDRGESGIIELQLQSIDGTVYEVNAGISVYHYHNTEYFVVIIRDMSELRSEYLKTNAEKEYFLHTLDSIGEAIIITDKDDKITRMNENATNMTGWNESTEGVPIHSVLTLLDYQYTRIDYLSVSEYQSSDALLVSTDGMYWHVSVTVRNIRNNHGIVLGKVYVIVDINEQKKREKEILYLSYHDVLTGLYNRAYLEEEIKRLDTKRQLPFSLIMGDVNGLKLSNDVFGHDVGDTLLKTVAKSLQYLCRQEDIVGRWGGDEFVILLPQTNEEEVHIIMYRIIQYFESLSTKDAIKGVTPSISLGYGVKKQTSDDIMDIMRIAETNMYKRKMLSKSSMHSKIITSMQKALQEKSSETQSHGNRLFDYLKGLAKQYGLSSDKRDDLELLCMLHDLGKIGIPDEILKKEGPLTDDEWREMKRHPEIGYRIAQASPELQNVAKYILSHHENYDGTGYPKGLKAHEIPLLSRMLAVADAYDAMTTQRPYNTIKSHEEAIQELKENAGTQFDPEIVDIFIETFGGDNSE
ncbi:MAG: HD domain-containing phosphohydrolase [Candidatus Izemoplasma sp.]|nr:HD domain-containing phosphohydrolase [Candidatus Izemoplasma sp.]